MRFERANNESLLHAVFKQLILILDGRSWEPEAENRHPCQGRMLLFMYALIGDLNIICEKHTISLQIFQNDFCLPLFFPL